MAKEGVLLVVDDNKAILTAVSLLLGQYFAKVVTVASPNLIHSTLRENAVDVVLLDMNFTSGINSGNEGIYWLMRIKEEDPAIQVVLFTAYADIDLAVKGIKEGAADFVVKPWDNEKLIATLQGAYNLRMSRKEMHQLKELKREMVTAKSDMYWGNTDVMKRLEESVNKVAATDATILITGENGTGKEVLATEIHLRSPRSKEIMVPVDMGAITETLFESELFGHVKGAFTDAKADRAGKFEVANKGTLFLDEIGNLPLHLQAKLLTAIQTYTIVRVGGNTPIKTDIRLICATNRDLPEMSRVGTFREDLLYRINTIHLELPALRERKEDIVPLAQRFLDKYAAKYHKAPMELASSAQSQLKEYPWPGNIRELQHTLEKAVIMSDGGALTAAGLFLPSRVEAVASVPSSTSAKTLEEMECDMIRAALQRHGGNMSAVAEQLGITRQTLYNRLKKFGL